ncbi:MAG TPA: reverse transcriptase domain-containing protein [Tenuifilaceae bacterium]|nr:reverse transcriptase domain-containing protein [Tenuifilaceae bacterium]
MKDKLDLKEYFSDKEIIKILCHKRAIAAKKGHDLHFLRNISAKACSPHKKCKNEIFTFFPPRNTWIRILKEEREKRDTNAVEINTIQLERTVWKEIKKYNSNGESKPEWMIKLESFLLDIKDSVFNQSLGYDIVPPKIIPVLKDKTKNEYRPISVFSLKDLIIIGQISKYLTYCFDPLFSDSSYAFRYTNPSKKTFNHHQAVQDIIDFKNKIGVPLYVSECDIKKFYDCVNHEVIIEKFKELVNEVDAKLKITIDNRAILLFHSYLGAFSFNENIYRIENQLLINHGISDGKIPWVKTSELEEVGSFIDSDKIGVPQGGAISCLIANIILNHVDRIVNSNSDESTFYCRFCDDMVLMHTNRDKCDELFKVYQKALKEVKLISHKSEPYDVYGKDFWNEKLKSKSPYKWDVYDSTSIENQRNVPWLSFVGYQIRHDGVIRVRKRSIKKELEKQIHETDKIIKNAKKSASINEKAIKFRLQQRLISMAVSRCRYGSSRVSMCWCAGFKLLRTHQNTTNQIRNLDRNREKQIKRLELHLKKIRTPFRKSKKKVAPLNYYGSNFSYNNQFLNEKNG